MDLSFTAQILVMKLTVNLKTMKYRLWDTTQVLCFGIDRDHAAIGRNLPNWNYFPLCPWQHKSLALSPSHSLQSLPEWLRFQTHHPS